MRVFLAGATGAIGKRLVPQLVACGHRVVATTRIVDKVDELLALGAEPVVVDGLNAVAVGEAVARAEPDAIIHRMTALAGKPDMKAAAVAALEHGRRGIYNIVDDEPAALVEWLPYLADVVGAKRPMHIPVWLGRLAAGEVGVSMMTQIRGSSNIKAKRELEWHPIWSSWRDGFQRGLGDVPVPAPRQNGG